MDPLKVDMNESAERRALSQLLDRGPDKPAGYVLPLKSRTDGFDTGAGCKILETAL